MIEMVSSHLAWSPKCIMGMSHHYPRHLAYMRRNTAFFPFLFPSLNWMVHMLLLESSLFQHNSLVLNINFNPEVTILQLQFWSQRSLCPYKTIRPRPSVNSDVGLLCRSLLDALRLILIIHRLDGVRYPFILGTDPRLGALSLAGTVLSLQPLLWMQV